MCSSDLYFYKNLCNFADVHFMEVVVIPLVNAFMVGNAFGIKTLSVHFFAFKNKLCLFKLYRAVFRERRSKTCFLYLVIILAAL